MQLRAVAFDIDGTLYPNYKMHLRSIPFFLGHPRMVWHFGRIRKEIRREEPIEDFYHRQAELLAERLGHSAGETRERINRTFYRSWEGIFRWIKPYPEVRETLEAFRSAGLALGAMSDFPPGRKLEYFGLMGLWDTVFSSQDLGYLKPHARPFEELARRLGTAPEETLYVGNSYAYDVDGARAAGMPAAHIGRPRPNDPADLEFRRFRELREFVLARVKNPPEGSPDVY